MNIITFIIAAVVAFVVQIVINKMANNQLIKFIPMGIIMIGMIICLIIYMGVFGSVTESALAENRAFAVRQLELAEYVGAACCVNISGAKGEVWDGFYPENYSEKTYADIVEYVISLLDAVKPERTKFTLEPMPHMLPDSPDSCLALIRDIGRPGFAAHIDIVNMIVSPRVYLGSEGLIKETFSKLGPHIVSCHLKDAVLGHGLTVSITETDCGRGGVDLRTYIAEADKVSRDMPMIIEHLSDLGRYSESVGYIKGLAGELGVKTDG